MSSYVGFEAVQNYGCIGLDWIVIGGESGPKARPFNLEWAREIVADCKAAEVPVFVKQCGSVPMITSFEWEEYLKASGRAILLNARNRGRVPLVYAPIKFQDKKGGNIEEWPEDLRVREYPVREEV